MAEATWNYTVVQDEDSLFDYIWKPLRNVADFMIGSYVAPERHSRVHSTGKSLTVAPAERFDLGRLVRTEEMVVQGFAIPRQLHKFGAAIAASSYISGLEADWDEDGAAPISQDTWRQSMYFMVSVAQRHFEESGNVLPVPSIQPGIDGEVELYWRYETRVLLVSFPADSTEPIAVRGQSVTDERSYIKGAFAESECAGWVEEWLVGASCQTPGR